MAERGLAIAFEKASSWLSLYDKLEAFFSNLLSQKHVSEVLHVKLISYLTSR